PILRWTTGESARLFRSSSASHAALYDIGTRRAACEMEPYLSIASSRRMRAPASTAPAGVCTSRRVCSLRLAMGRVATEDGYVLDYTANTTHQPVTSAVIRSAMVESTERSLLDCSHRFNANRNPADLPTSKGASRQHPHQPTKESTMKISARNQFEGTIS